MSKQAGTVIVIGAGISGLATANLLAQAGFTVTVYEKNDQAGGRAGQLKAEGFTFDTGPSWYLMPGVFERYYNLLGTSAAQELDLIKLDPAYKVFFEQTAPITITGDQQTDMATFEAIEPGAGEKLRSYIEDGATIYQLSLRHFLYTSFSSIRDLCKWDTIRRGPKMLRLALRPLHAHVARYVHTKQLQQILEYPTVFLGTSPFSAPAIYSLMSALDFREGVYYPRSGMYEIITSLVRQAERLGVTVQLDSPVQSIQAQGGRAMGIVLEDGTVVTADIVVSSADLPYTEMTLLPAELQSFPETYWHKKEAGISALLMYLGVRGELPMLAHHNLLFVDSWEENFAAIYKTKQYPHPASLYISRTSATDDSVAPAVSENIFVLVPLPSGVIPTETEIKELTRQYIAQIQTMTGISDFASRITYQRIFGPQDFVTRFHAYQASALGMSHLLRQSAFFRTPNKSKKLDNLYYVGANTVPGIGLPMCLISAELLSKRIKKEQL